MHSNWNNFLDTGFLWTGRCFSVFCIKKHVYMGIIEKIEKTKNGVLIFHLNDVKRTSIMGRPYTFEEGGWEPADLPQFRIRKVGEWPTVCEGGTFIIRRQAYTVVISRKGYKPD